MVHAAFTFQLSPVFHKGRPRGEAENRPRGPEMPTTIVTTAAPGQSFTEVRLGHSHTRTHTRERK